jgi:protein-L-isoaspartate(D-aspartate) O-methyltransferase
MTETISDRSADVSALRQKLVEELKTTGVISNPLVEAAFSAVPRHLFVPETARGSLLRPGDRNQRDRWHASQ